MDSEGCGCCCSDSQVLGFVLSTNLQFRVWQQGCQTARGFGLWHFALLLFRSCPPTSCSLQALDDSIKNIRKCGSNVVKCINKNSGWDMLAWHKRGTQTDSSARSANANPAEASWQEQSCPSWQALSLAAAICYLPLSCSLSAMLCSCQWLHGPNLSNNHLLF